MCVEQSCTQMFFLIFIFVNKTALTLDGSAAPFLFFLQWFCSIRAFNSFKTDCQDYLYWVYIWTFIVLQKWNSKPFSVWLQKTCQYLCDLKTVFLLDHFASLYKPPRWNGFTDRATCCLSTSLHVLLNSFDILRRENKAAVKTLAPITVNIRNI